MRQVILGLMVVGVLASVTAFGLTGSPTAEPSPLKVSVEDKNPWTNQPLNNRADNFQFAIVTDRTGGRRPGVFTRAIEKLNLLQPEFVVSVGDLINGYTEDPGLWALEWAEFEGKVDQLQMPFFLCAGNHDITNLPMSQEWQRKFGRTHYEFLYHDCLFLVLNTEDMPYNSKEQPYRIGPDQQKWAADILERHKDVRWTFVLLHKPTWTYPDADHAACGWSSIESALGDRKFTVFAGHRHQYGKFIRNGREYYMLATTGGGSKMTGLADGRFDHFVWVTMQDQGPVLANILLEGVEDSDVRRLP